ncbi:MAG: trypsin-like peptidase domain-containing protein [Bowdeniella nasicola]|nr:trypsin-like peptidase domain-containing protein [Bowdeniella nasicola]
MYPTNSQPTGPTSPGGAQHEWISPDFDRRGTPKQVAPGYARPANVRAVRRPSWAALLTTALLAALLASGITVGVNHVVSEPQSGRSAQQEDTLAATVATPIDNWEGVATQVKDTVVSITTRTQSGGDAGSGVILDTNGHILTNHHVIRGAESIEVQLADGRIYPADIRGSDAATDLAVITLKDAPANDLKAASFADSNTLKVGQPVVAVGNPLGLSHTVTTGVVSALNRPVTTRTIIDQGPFQKVAANVITNAVQIDASINPGNSGGPIFDATGSVIGISSSIATLGQEGASGSIGLGFAIPANLASRVADDLIADGVAEHAFLGVQVGDGQAKDDGAIRAGALLGSIEANSPAAKAGLRPKDVVIAINDQPVASANALVGFVRQYASGDKINVTYLRGGARQVTEVELAARPDSL